MNTQIATHLCPSCLSGAHGTGGHDRLSFYVEGPYPGHHIFKCEDCGDRWIRHYGSTDSYAWTRYAEQFGIRRPRQSEPASART